MTLFSFSNFFQTFTFTFFISPFSHSLTPLTQPRSRKKSVMVDLDINKVGSCQKKILHFPLVNLLKIQKIFPICFGRYYWKCRSYFLFVFVNIAGIQDRGLCVEFIQDIKSQGDASTLSTSANLTEIQ